MSGLAIRMDGKLLDYCLWGLLRTISSTLLISTMICGSCWSPVSPDLQFSCSYFYSLTFEALFAASGVGVVAVI